MAIYDFVCRCGEVTEARAGYEARTLPCPACGRTAVRKAVYSVFLGTKEKKYRVSDFLEASHEIDHAYSQVESREGRQVKRPNLYKNAMRKVRRAHV